MIKIYKWSSWVAVTLWVLTGVIITGSMILSPIGFAINIILGTFICLLGVYQAFRARAVLRLAGAVSKPGNGERHPDILAKMTRFLIWDLMLNGLSILFGTVLLWAASYRVFVERMPVFG
jgi:hypothetical protein